MRHLGLVLLLAVLSLAFTGDNELAARFDAYHHIAPTGQKMPYRLFVPEQYDSTQAYPLVLWLHGTSGRGTDNIGQLSRSNEYGPEFFTDPAHQAQHPTFVLAPQCPPRKRWAGGYSEGPSDQMQQVMALLEEIKAQYNIDPSRIYVVGKSLGGFGAWAFAAEYPGTFAAAVPMCGGSHPSKAPLLIHTPIWAFHGTADRTVNVRRSREMVAAIREAGGTPRYSEYRGVGHDVWHQAFEEPELLDWLFSQRRAMQVAELPREW